MKRHLIKNKVTGGFDLNKLFKSFPHFRTSEVVTIPNEKGNQVDES